MLNFERSEGDTYNEYTIHMIFYHTCNFNMKIVLFLLILDQTIFIGVEPCEGNRKFH